MAIMSKQYCFDIIEKITFVSKLLCINYIEKWPVLCQYNSCLADKDFASESNNNVIQRLWCIHK